LVDLAISGRQVKALAQIMKTGYTFVLDRVTGKPIFPIEERPVPPSDVPGEKASPTQPFPTKPVPFEVTGVTLDDLIDFTPELKGEAVRIASQYKFGPLYTPPIVAGSNGLKGLLFRPASANWEGGAVDPETGILYVSSASNTRVTGLIRGDPSRTNLDYVGGGGGGEGGGSGRSLGTAPEPAPRADARIGSVVSAQPREGCGEIGPRGLPLFKPPWGRISAIDLITGDQVWWAPNGETADCIKNHPALKGINIPKGGKPERAGIMVTKTLLFAGEGAGLLAVPAYSGGPMFRAYDKKTGEVVWEFKLPGNQSGIPMTYLVSGKQFIVVPVAGRNIAAELVALGLP
jgi:quinoprotein glucose dehydrogenase